MFASNKQVLSCLKVCKSNLYNSSQSDKNGSVNGPNLDFPALHNNLLLKTHCEVMDGSHSQSVTKILTAYWSKKTYFRPGARKTEIHSFPTMYIMGGGSFGGNGSK